MDGLQFSFSNHVIFQHIYVFNTKTALVVCTSQRARTVLTSKFFLIVKKSAYVHSL